jgi:hypothetical protein
MRFEAVVERLVQAESRAGLQSDACAAYIVCVDSMIILAVFPRTWN